MIVEKFKKILTNKMEAAGMGTPIFKEVETPKKNIALHSIAISRSDSSNDSCKISATVHKETLYKFNDYEPERRDRELSEYADAVIKEFDESLDLNTMFSLPYIKENALPIILPKSKNLHLLKTIPHEEIMEEFIVLFAVVAKDEYGRSMSFNISHGLIHTLAKSNQMAEADVLSDIKAAARKNLAEKTSILTMYEQLKEMGFPVFFKADDGPTMLVVKTGRYGAAGAFISKEVQDKIHQRIGDFYILPSSIHETLCLPSRDVSDTSALYEMVSQVNETEVSETEFLSDNVFYYDGTLKKAV